MKPINLNHEFSPISSEIIIDDDKYKNTKKCSIRQSYRRIIRHMNTFGLVLYFIIMIATDILYAKYQRTCPYVTVQNCYSYFVGDIGLSTIIAFQLALGVIYAIFMWLSLFKFVRRSIFWITLTNELVMIGIFHKEASLYDISHLYSYFLAFFTIVGLSVLSFLWLFTYMTILAFKQKKILLILCLYGLMYFTISFYVNNHLKPSIYWTEGISGRKLQDSTPDGQKYCKISIPQRDWHGLLDGVIDPTNVFQDCTKQEFNNYDNSRKIIDEFIVAKQRFIAFPLLNDLELPLQRSFTQEFLMTMADGYDNLSEVPPHHEFILDAETLTYTINVKRNETLVEMRSKLRAEQKPNERKLSKNIITIYIDALSRVTFPKKLPKVFNWFAEFERKNQKESVVFQGLRAHSLAGFTYHNVMAYFYGAVSERLINNHSPYSLLKGATDTVITQEENQATGKFEDQVHYGGSKYYESFIGTLQSKGYITGQTSTDCATSPLTQDGGAFKFIQRLLYDHIGIAHSCDPNYFMPENRESSGGGPYSVFRRCLYGVEMIDHSISYAKQFMQAYHDQPKQFSFELIEAHEKNQEVISYQDEKLVNFLNWLDMNGHLENSTLFFLSDHGMHMENIIYDMMPVNLPNHDNGFPIYIAVLSKSLLTKEDIHNLQQNEQRVTTMFEIYYFIRYLAQYEDEKMLRDNSLVSAFIPVNRSSFNLPKLDALPMICLMSRQ